MKRLRWIYRWMFCYFMCADDDYGYCMHSCARCTGATS